MQPPPQTAPATVGGPPPLAPSWNMHWRNGSYGRRANAPLAAASARAVLPVTDPFAFGKQPPRAPPLSSAPQGDPAAAQGFLPMAFPPAAAAAAAHLPPPPHAEGSFPGLDPPFGSVPISLPGARSTFSNPTDDALPAFPEAAESRLGMQLPLERSLPDPTGPSEPVRMATGNLGGARQVPASVPDRPPSGPDMSRIPGYHGSVPSPLPTFPHAQQMGPPRMPPPSPAYLPYPEPPSSNGSCGIPRPSVAFPHRDPQVPQQPALQNASQAPLLLGEASGMSVLHSSPWQRAGASSPWPIQLSREHIYLQPLEAACLPGNPASLDSSTSGPARGVSEAGGGQGPCKVDSGTVSMFFKGDEAENEEILSAEKSDHADSFQETMGHTYYQPLHARQGPAAPFPAAEALPRGADGQRSFRAAAAEQAGGKGPFLSEGGSSLGQAGGHAVEAPYENVENQEYVQNQEVLPSEPPSSKHQSPGALPDSDRYASFALLLPKSSAAEGGPNLEAPDRFPRPPPPDSVSSNYSSVSRRSVPNSAQPQEFGTFIQQESGKPDQDGPRSFFKQIDSSPLGGDAGQQEAGKSFCSPRSQELAPSPPKPTGVFQPSANSSFEPVRSHSLGLRPPESDQAKMVGELREMGSSQRSPALPVASPGNLEQPPDNLETFFLPPAHPLPLPLGSHGSPQRGPGAGHVPMAPEKRSTARGQGSRKKCESPATTLWAHSELPSFGGSVLLAPAAPAVYVLAKQPAQGIQPPKGAPPTQQPDKPGSQAGSLPSENLENPPKLGDEDSLCSQAGPGYASLLSSPPTEALQNQPVLLAQPHQSSSPAQPLLSAGAGPPGRPEQTRSSNSPGIGSPPLQARNSGGGGSLGENVPLPAGQPGWPGHSATLFHSPPGAAETATKTSLNQQGAHIPRGLAAEGQQDPSAEGLPPEATGEPGAAGGPGSVLGHHPQNAPGRQEFSEALDFTGGKAQEPSAAGNGPQELGQTFPLGPQAHNQPHFYQQVTKDFQPPAAASQLPSGAPYPRMPPGNGPAQTLSQKPCPASPSEDRSAQPLPTDCRPGPPSSAAPSTFPPVSTAPGGGQPVRPPSHQEQQYPPPSQNAFGLPPNSYYYYRQPYDSYPYSAVDPRAAHLYYQPAPIPENSERRARSSRSSSQDMYDPACAQYNSAAAYQDPGSYWYAEPERPNSRASHASDRPRSRQGYPDEYYSAKSGWNDYYADYYANPYSGGAYDARFRDPRLYDQRYWYNTDVNLYPKREAYPRGNSHDRYDDHWQYDPRFVSSFEEELEPRREPFENDCDCRSVHSELSGHSLHSSRSIRSRQSSFSSRSQQSQRYRSSQDLSANAFEADHPPAARHADYYGAGYLTNPPALSDFNPLAQAAWSGVEQVPSRPLTPEKFSVPHVCAKFGPGGCLVKALPNVPSEGQPALVELHSMEMVMRRSSEQEEMRAFPGPLTKDDTHKVDVINFAQNKATRCFQNNALIDKESSRLLWDFIVLLCRQNGTVVGTDLAELLLQDHKTVWLPGKSPNEANLIDFTNEALEQAEEEPGEAQLSFLTDNLIATIDGIEKETERFRELLLYGRKKDALESAMKHGLWGHALLLASKMDSRTHARVMTRFANSLPINDPLQTVYQLMSGRMPAASTCCGEEKWGDWRPHLAMVLSNLTNNVDVESRTIVTMGDTLASKGLLDAAHFCYLMAQVGFGVYTKKTTKLVLIGANHSLPFSKFASNEAIQRTEAYEYAQSLGTEPCSLPNFQVFKFIYACRLAEMGLAAQAFHYCEVISKAVLKNPRDYCPALISQVVQISSRLRLFDPQIKEKPEQELFIEPDWLVHLRILDGQIKEGSLRYSTGRSTPQHCASSTPSSELDRASRHESQGGIPEMSSDNPLLASLLPKMGHPTQNVQLMPSAPQTILENLGAAGPPSQLEAAAALPFYPIAPLSAGPGPGLSSPPGAEPGPGYLGSAVPPAGPPAPAPELLLPPPEAAPREAAPGDSPAWKGAPESREEDFYGKMASMGPGRRSRSTSQSSAHMGLGRRSRTTSESSVHSVGRERRNSAAKQPSPPPPPSIPEGKKAPKEQVPRKSGATWFGWLMGKGRNEAHLPDDKNKSIVWDEKKQRWVNLDEPEEESKLPPPPPVGFPQAAPAGLTGPSNPSVNMFSRKAAGSKARYVDILNANQAKPPSAAPAPAPADLFAPLAPIPIPANLFVPNSVPEEPLEGRSGQEMVAPGSPAPGSPEVAAELPYLNSPPFLPGTELPASNLDDVLSGEPPSTEPPSGSIQFYNPSQFAQPAAVPTSSRISRIGQRKYPTLK